MPAIPTRRLNEAQVFAEGLALHRLGKLIAAEARYQAILQQNPHHADANNGMGALSIAADKADFAIGFFEAAVRERPNDFRFLNNLGNVFMDTGRTEEGLPFLDKALKLRPANYEVMFNIGRAYQKMGLAERGVEYLDRAVKARPEHLEGIIALADALGTLGRNDEAEAWFRRAEALGAPMSAVLFGIANGRKQTADNNILAEIDQALAAATPETKTTRLHYAAAKVSMDLRLTDRAWSHLVAANAASGHFDIARYTAELDAMIALFNPPFMTSRQGFGSPSERPVFIVGMPRSGTSLTEQILSSHPEVHGAGELTYMHTLANKLFYSLSVRDIFAEQVRALALIL